MTRRIHRQQLTFEAGEVSESYASRHDVDKRLSGAQEITNMVVDEGGGLLPRGSITRRSDWVNGFFTSNGEPSFVAFPFAARTRMGSSGSEGEPIDFIIILHNVVAGELSETVSISKFTPSENALFTLATTITLDGTYIGPSPDAVPRLGGEDITINAAQANESLFIVGSHFHPRRFVETNNPGDTTGTIQEIQFYKDLVGLVDLNVGDPPDPTLVVATSGLDTEFEWELAAFPPSDLNFVRIGGVEYEIDSIASSSTLTLSEDWEPESDAQDILSIIGENPSGVQLQRRWPIRNAQNEAGSFLDDGVFRPRVVAFSQGRLILGSTLTGGTLGDNTLISPTGLWLSRVGDPFTVMPAYKYTNPSTGDALVPPQSPIQVDLLLDAGDAFEWALGTTQVYLGSSKSIYALTNTQNGIDAGGLVGAQKISGVGAKGIQAAERDGDPIYVANDSGGVMGARFDLLSQSFSRDDLTRHTKELASDLSGITYEVPREGYRAERVLCVNADGGVVSGGIFPDRDLVAWSKLEMSGASGMTIHGVYSLNSGVYAFLRESESSGLSSIVRFDDAPSTIGDKDYAVDLPSAMANKPNWNTADVGFFSRTVAAIVRIDGEWLHLGPVNIDASGNLLYIGDIITGTPSGNGGNLGYETIDGTRLDYGIEPNDPLLSDIYIGFPYTQSVTLFPQASSDGRGFSIGRRTRILSVSCDVVRTRQFKIDGRTVYSNIVVAGSDPRERTEWKRRRLIGRGNADRAIKIESVEPYPLRLRAVVQEVSV